MRMKDLRERIRVRIGKSAIVVTDDELKAAIEAVYRDIARAAQEAKT